MRSKSISGAMQIFKDSWFVFRRQWLLLLPFAILGFMSKFLAPLYTLIFSYSTNQDIGYLVCLSLGVIMGFTCNACLFFQVYACIDKKWVSYKQALIDGLLKTPKVIFGYLIMVFIFLLGFLISSAVVGGLNNVILKVGFSIFFSILIFMIYVRYCLYYPYILLNGDSVWRGFIHSFRVMRDINHRYLTMTTLIGIPLLYLIFIVIPVGLLSLIAWQLNYFNEIDFNVLAQIYQMTNDQKTLTPFMQAQKSLFFQMITNISLLYNILVFIFKPFIYILWGVLFKQLSSKESTNQIDLETIKV